VYFATKRGCGKVGGFEAIIGRRSIRKYTRDPVSEDNISIVDILSL